MTVLFRHIELSSNVASSKFVFTVTPFGGMPQGRVGFNTLQVSNRWIDLIGGERRSWCLAPLGWH